MNARRPGDHRGMYDKWYDVKVFFGWVAIIAVLAFGLVSFLSLSHDCSARHGVVVETFIGYGCVQPAPEAK